MLKLSFLLYLFIAIDVYAYFWTNIPEENSLRLIKQFATAPSKDHHKLLLWNIFKNRKPSFKSELKRIRNQFSPDIFLFQEVPYSYTDEKKELKKEICLPESDCFVGLAFKFSNPLTRNDERYGVLTSSIFKISKPEVIQSKNFEPVINTTKSTLITIIEGPREDLLLINTHAINFTLTEHYTAQLQEVVNAVKSFNGPIIWASDFNSWNPERVETLNNVTKQLGLKELEIKNSHLIKSFIGFPLDKVFYRGISRIKGEALSSTGSDHNPIIIEYFLD